MLMNEDWIKLKDYIDRYMIRPILITLNLRR